LHVGAAKRLRPILMTAAATIFALIPMALGLTGNGGFIAQPLAVVVIGGLISSTLLTLVIVPVLYPIAEGPGERKRVEEEEGQRRAASRVRRARVEAEERSRPRAEQQEQTRPEDGGRAVTTEGRATVGPTAPEPASRRSLKERGGLVGIVRRRLRRR